MKKIAVLTSGGDAPGMNAAIRAVVRAAVFHDLEVTGVFQGYHGLIQGDFKRLHVRSVAKILGRGGTILKSARCEEFRSVAGRRAAYEQLRKHEVDGLVAIGGNGTSAQAADGIGKVAAAMVIHNQWHSDLDANEFRLVYADEHVDWRNRELVRGSMKR